MDRSSWLRHALVAAPFLVTACGGIASSSSASPDSGAPPDGGLHPPIDSGSAPDTAPSTTAACPFSTVTLLASVPSGRIVSSTDTAATSLAVDGTYVYFTTQTLGPTTAGVWKMPKCGGAPVSLASGGKRPLSIAVDADNAYWIDFEQGTVNRVPLGGGAVVPLMSDPQTIPQSLVLDSDHVYWTSLAVLGPDQPGMVSLFAVPKAGGAPQAIFTSGSDVSGLAADGSGVYVSGVGPNDNPPGESLYRASLAGPPLQLRGGIGCTDLRVDASFVYCAFLDKLTFLTLDGTAELEMTEPGGHAIVGMAPDPGGLLFTTTGSPDPNSFGDLPDAVLDSIPAPGARPTSLVTGLAYPSAVATDGVNVYFVASDGVYGFARQ